LLRTAGSYCLGMRMRYCRLNAFGFLDTEHTCGLARIIRHGKTSAGGHENACGVRALKGSKCKCGFATLSDKRICPRCGKRMRPEEWPDEGKVLSFTRLQAIPEGLEDPYNMALVGIEKGPKVICWTSGTLKEKDEVRITEVKGRYICVPKSSLGFKLPETSETD